MNPLVLFFSLVALLGMVVGVTLAYCTWQGASVLNLAVPWIPTWALFSVLLPLEFYLGFKSWYERVRLPVLSVMTASGLFFVQQLDALSAVLAPALVWAGLFVVFHAMHWALERSASKSMSDSLAAAKKQGSPARLP